MLVRIKKHLVLLLFPAALLAGCEKNLTEKADDLYAQKEFGLAVEAYTTYLQDFPKDCKSYYNRGRAYEELGDLEKALSDFQSATSCDPSSHLFRMAVGLCQYRLKRFDMAVFAMDAVLEKTPNDAEAHYVKARALQQRSEFAAALEGFETVIRLNKDHGGAYLHRGIMHVQTNKKKQGCADLQKAKKLKEPNADDAIARYCK